jgi:hypothetical protein
MKRYAFVSEPGAGNVTRETLGKHGRYVLIASGTMQFSVKRAEISTHLQWP